MVALYVHETLEDKGTKKPSFFTLQDYCYLDVNVSDLIEKCYFVVSHFINKYLLFLYENFI